MTNDEEINNIVNIIDSLENTENLTNKHFEILKKYISHENAFVRSRCAYMLCEFGTEQARNLLYYLCSYAVLSWCDVVYRLHVKYDNDMKFLLECWYGLYLFGDGQALNKMLDFLKSKDYAVRCSVLNLLSDVMKKEDKYIIMSAIEELLKTEKTTAVKSDAEKIINLLADM